MGIRTNIALLGAGGSNAWNTGRRRQAAKPLRSAAGMKHYWALLLALLLLLLLLRRRRRQQQPRWPASWPLGPGGQALHRQGSNRKGLLLLLLLLLLLRGDNQAPRLKCRRQAGRQRQRPVLEGWRGGRRRLLLPRLHLLLCLHLCPSLRRWRYLLTGNPRQRLR